MPPSRPCPPPRGALLLVLLLSLAAPAAARGAGGGDFPPSPGEEGEVTGRSRVWARLESFTWREYLGKRRLLEETGLRYAVGAERAFNRDDVTFTPGVELLYGLVDYDGHTTTGQDAETDVEYRGASLSADVGNVFRLRGGGSLEPHVGARWEYWKRDLRDSSNARGYEERWDTVVVRGGLRGALPLAGEGGRLRLFGDGGIAWPVTTNNVVEYPTLVGRDDVTVHPEGKPWPYAEAGVAAGAFRAALSYRGFRFEESDRVFISTTLGDGYIYQPESQSDVWSLEVSLAF